MTSLLPRPQVLFPNVADWFDHARSFGGNNLLRIEECDHKNKYVVRAELPGVDPEKHVHVTVHGKVLTVTAEREASHKDSRHSEFHYGSFSRSVNLPVGADTSDVSAKYTDGILEVTVPVQQRQEDQAKQIKIATD
ncbi:heat shock protein Hsp20 [Segniliparus rotundus DSM 44985]|uniref:Heat shock protein Hsp20 n=1 Tax=Segniliparus rotundus (strain ATCC BAA-972 / CDC 1076 / CIP 108378 / DSM 44985 / JCM 13578) TaxID=640132 RepID=D6ZAS5_SEGRD|nr:Hsp20/alpha crystallin family protein [Segniliparus rotundus]ADG98811.1 heat shock protein Hsp20 [Segniliparus rotundus DSM 44985]